MGMGQCKPQATSARGLSVGATTDLLLLGIGLLVLHHRFVHRLSRVYFALGWGQLFDATQQAGRQAGRRATNILFYTRKGTRFDDMQCTTSYGANE